MTAPLVAWAPCGSDVGPRGMPRALLELGPLAWGRDHVAPKMLGKDFTHCCIFMPGGREDDNSSLRFDTIDRAASHADQRVSACGDYSLWGEVAQNIREIVGCKVGFYLGTCHHLSAPRTIELCDQMISQWHGFIDFLCIDELAGRPMGHNNHVAAHRLAAAGVEIWAEPRPVRGCPLYPTVNMCLASKYHRHGSAYGDRDHSSKAEIEAHGASLVLIDDISVHKDTVQIARAGGIGYAVAPSFVPVVGDVGGPV